MKVIITDGGRVDAGYKGSAGDCVTRAVAIATEQAYSTVYDAFKEHAKSERLTQRRKTRSSVRDGVDTTRQWFKDYMASIGWKWTATMLVGQGCKVHLTEGELPSGRLIVAVSKHYTAVIDGVIYDSHDPQREGTRCVYGYWSKV